MATQLDADILLKFYDLRREAVMRAARHFVVFEWQPKTFEEFIEGAMGSGKVNEALRQVGSYWEMGASMVLRGAIDGDLFLDSQAEGIFIFAKFRRFHDDYAAKTGSAFMVNTKKLIDSSERAKTVYASIVKRQEAREAAKS